VTGFVVFGIHSDRRLLPKSSMELPLKLADREPEAPVISTFRPERRTDLDITTDGMCSLAYEPTLGWTRDACKARPSACANPVRRPCAPEVVDEVAEAVMAEVAVARAEVAVARAAVAKAAATVRRAAEVMVQVAVARAMTVVTMGGGRKGGAACCPDGLSQRMVRASLRLRSEIQATRLGCCDCVGSSHRALVGQMVTARLPAETLRVQKAAVRSAKSPSDIPQPPSPSACHLRHNHSRLRHRPERASAHPL
jgi:hypothetical protein